MSNITLINDDCLSALNRGGKDIVVSDPPFNIGYHYNSYEDNMSENDYLEMLKKVFTPPCVMIHYPEAIYKFCVYAQLVPEKVVSWIYNSNTGKQHRDIAFFGVKPDFNAVKQPYKNLADKRIQQRLADGKTGAKLYDWWEINQVKNTSVDKTEHPCQMPVEVMNNIIGILPSDYTIIDPFMGSGTTGVACVKYNRDFVGIERDKLYYDIAKARIEKENYLSSKTQISIFDLLKEVTNDK